MKKALVLFSGGVDSTTALALAIEKYGKDNVIALSVVYGQKHDKEFECSCKIARYYCVEHIYLDLSKIFEYSDCTLLKHSSKEVPHEAYEEQIKDYLDDQKSIKEDMEEVIKIIALEKEILVFLKDNQNSWSLQNKNIYFKEIVNNCKVENLPETTIDGYVKILNSLLNDMYNAKLENAISESNATLTTLQSLTRIDGIQKDSIQDFCVNLKSH